jgi:hypothetical protein
MAQAHFISSISAAQKAEQLPKQEKLRRVGGKLPRRERERGEGGMVELLFCNFSHTAISSPLRCKRFHGTPREARTAFSLFLAWRGVEWSGVVWQQQRKGELQSHCQERLKERRKASSVTRKASGTECSFAPSAVRFLRPSEQEPGSRQRPSQPLFLSSWGALSLFGLPSHAKNRSLASFRFALLLFRVWSEPVR